MAITIQELLKQTVDRNASDLHLSTRIPPRIRVHGRLISLDYPVLTPVETKELVYSLLTDKHSRKSSSLIFHLALKISAVFGEMSICRGVLLRLHSGDSSARIGVLLNWGFLRGSPSSVRCRGDWSW